MVDKQLLVAGTHPSIWILSRTSQRCGEVKRPVLYPQQRRMLSTMAHVEPCIADKGTAVMLAVLQLVFW